VGGGKRKNIRITVLSNVVHQKPNSRKGTGQRMKKAPTLGFGGAEEGRKVLSFWEGRN